MTILTVQGMTRAEMETRIKHMTREEKIVELRHYFDSLHNTTLPQNLNLENAPDDEIEIALQRFARKVGDIFGSDTHLTAEQFASILQQTRSLHKAHPTLQRLGEPVSGLLEE
jgi:hypothetical protein